MGLKVNAFHVITGQQRVFQLSQARLEQAMQETIQQSCVDVTLAQQVRREALADLQFHYNLVFPTQQRFGSTIERVHADVYNMANDGPSILALFLRGAVFARRTMNMRSQKARCMRVAPSLDRLVFSRIGEEVEDEVSLSDVMGIELNETEKNQPMIVIVFTNKRSMMLQCDLVAERNRWTMYLKVLFRWYRETGFTLITSMTSKLDLEDKGLFAAIHTLEELEELEEQSLVKKVVKMINDSFLSFVAEKEKPIDDRLPFNISMDCMSSRACMTCRSRADAQRAILAAPPDLGAGAHTRVLSLRHHAADRLLLGAARTRVPGSCRDDV